ncbi:glutamine-fructose-6-phosphate transaminase [Reticulomyxa filosa]|uniref:Glutamine-fructose-6-phosphate transaminase n=1 Tax=Reticulomyxa filosa TaxID=46433 RepID=X6MW90_RETFI|nr:glutamine-fructose-6-phosphate transaminase [Reticulomyxa filosa]|eukprot:ETO17876.1 glutamine-fructose-6-phosphate transaminase [Reticulomyxa filosa]
MIPRQFAYFGHIKSKKNLCTPIDHNKQKKKKKSISRIAAGMQRMESKDNERHKEDNSKKNNWTEQHEYVYYGLIGGLAMAISASHMLEKKKSVKACGIMGMVGNEPVVDYLLAGLNILQNRGYDSAGIATIGTEDQVHEESHHSSSDDSSAALLTKSLPKSKPCKRRRPPPRRKSIITTRLPCMPIVLISLSPSTLPKARQVIPWIY